MRSVARQIAEPKRPQRARATRVAVGQVERLPQIAQAVRVAVRVEPHALELREGAARESGESGGSFARCSCRRACIRSIWMASLYAIARYTLKSSRTEPTASAAYLDFR